MTIRNFSSLLFIVLITLTACNYDLHMEYMAETGKTDSTENTDTARVSYFEKLKEKRLLQKQEREAERQRKEEEAAAQRTTTTAAAKRGSGSGSGYGAEDIVDTNLPDLMVKNFTATASSTKVGGALTVYYEIASDSFEPVNNADIRFSLKEGDTVIRSETLLIDTIDSLETKSGTWPSGNVSANAGTFTFTIEIDPGEQIKEKSRANNSMTAEATVN